jgi:UDP-4-amino-4,6-dideoxy-N-acetyl-beta-L-altrosamine transaminase
MKSFTPTNPIPYGKQEINQADIDSVVAVLKSDFLTQGPSILEFEQKFATYIGVNYAVAVANGTAALHLCTMVLGVNPSSNVITTPITFAASANCVKYCGGEVTFVDINPETATMDLDKLYALVKSKPKGTFSGIIPVDFAGYPVDLEKLRQLADEFGLWIIEDACHAPGGYFIDSNNKQQNCGNGQYAELAIFSFHPVKHIASGEGGMITTNDKALYDKLILLRTHGITKEADKFINTTETVEQGGWYMEMQELGYNYRLSDMQAALGISQLNRAEQGLKRRKALAMKYDLAFEKAGIKIIKPTSEIGHAYHLYVISIQDRKGLYNYLKENKIFAQVHYIPLHLAPYYQSLGFKKGDFPEAEKYYEACLSIPMFPALTDEEQEYVIEKIVNYTYKN